MLCKALMPLLLKHFQTNNTVARHIRFRMYKGYFWNNLSYVAKKDNRQMQT